MAAAHPFQPAELEEALRKVAKREPLTRDERRLVLLRLDEIPLADESGEDGARDPKPPIDPMDAPFDDEPEDAPEEAAITAEARAQVARGEHFSSDEVRRRLAL